MTKECPNPNAQTRRKTVHIKETRQPRLSVFVLVRGFLGGNSNATTGDFSLGIYGTLIENGRLLHAVAEMNIAGNHPQLWQRLIAVGNDPYPYSAWRLPSLVFDAVQFSGT